MSDTSKIEEQKDPCSLCKLLIPRKIAIWQTIHSLAYPFCTTCFKKLVEIGWDNRGDAEVVLATDIRRGDEVRITMSPGFWRQGIVRTVENWGRRTWSAGNEPDNWYIQLTVTEGQGHEPIQNYGYWKQKEDGGVVQLIKKAEVA